MFIKFIEVFDNLDIVQYLCIYIIYTLFKKKLKIFLTGFDIGVNKSVMEMITGLKCGPPRLPLLPASTEHVEAIQNDLKNIGFFDFRK